MSEAQYVELARRISDLEGQISLLEAPTWKRVLFYVNGWPRLVIPATEQRWRPWHRWWGRRDRDYTTRIGRFMNGRFASGR
jgi:hypothetical protein